MAIRHKIIRNKGGCYWGKATDVAEAISRKAMEHLVKPLNDEEHELAEKIYARIIKECSLTEKQIKAMAERKLVDMTANTAIEVQDASGNTLSCSTHNEGGKEKYIESTTYSRMCVKDDALYAEIADLEARRNAVEAQRNDMMVALRDQINGRSTKEVFGEWPEAIPIVAQVMEMELDRPPLIKPLEQLLAKFLPALPAPK